MFVCRAEILLSVCFVHLDMNMRVFTVSVYVAVNGVGFYFVSGLLSSVLLR
ncbi:hypothetical protein EXN66_Car005649 [Channa argus]|uniref:Uncharacterized protein n=1 Tax=Channa argus TaxID=215402 RepID=A0A6G1PIB5_CHAAH|nr:hypothetical protein EXN66_Car005649 [Channa argus]